MPHKPPDQDDSAHKAPPATAQALRLLCRRARSAAELNQLLARDGHSPRACAQALEAARRWGYVQDDRLAESLGASATRRGRGSRWLAQQLAARKLTGPVPLAVTTQHEQSEPAAIAALLRRRFDALALAADAKLRARAARFLLGRGFAAHNVQAALAAAGPARDD